MVNVKVNVDLVVDKFGDYATSVLASDESLKYFAGRLAPSERDIVFIMREYYLFTKGKKDSKSLDSFIEQKQKVSDLTPGEFYTFMRMAERIKDEKGSTLVNYSFSPIGQNYFEKLLPEHVRDMCKRGVSADILKTAEYAEKAAAAGVRNPERQEELNKRKEKRVSDRRREDLFKNIDTKEFSLKLPSNKPSAEGIGSITGFLKSVHNYLGYSEAEINKTYLRGYCTTFASLIFDVYKKHGDLEHIRFTSPHEHEKEEFYDHYAVRLKTNPDEFFDITGGQTEKEMQQKLGGLWKMHPSQIGHKVCGYSPSGGTRITTYCSNNTKTPGAPKVAR